MNPAHRLPSLFRVCFGISLLAFVLAGCATKSKTGQAVFFPPAPDQPRIQYLTSFSSEGEYAGQGGFKDFIVGGGTLKRPLWKPYGVSARPGTLYFCDTQAKNVAMLDLGKKRITYIRPRGKDAFGTPIHVVADSAGNKYASDPSGGKLYVFGPDNRLKDFFAPEALGKPCGLALVHDRLYVGDMSNRCVKAFALPSRELVMSLPSEGAPETAQVRGPTNLAVDEQGRVYVSDTKDFTIKVFDATGKHLRTIGDLGLVPGTFALPKGIAVDREGRIYVADASTAVVQLFNNDGQLLMYFAGPDSPAGAACYLPAGLAVDYDNVKYFQQFVAPGRQIEYLIYVVNQLGTRKVSVYGFLKQ